MEHGDNREREADQIIGEREEEKIEKGKDREKRAGQKIERARREGRGG